MPDPWRPDRRVRALLVDRGLDSREMYAEFLTYAGYETDQTDDGRIALAKALSAHPDVVVMDMRLRGMSGFALCRLLREDVSTQDIPIVVVTADGLEPDLTQAQQVGATVVLTKPCLPDRLAYTIAKVVQQSRGLRTQSRDLADQVHLVACTE